MTATADQAYEISGIDKVVVWLSRHWLFVANLFVGASVLAPILAPALMATGFTFPAKMIYWIYSFLCHQLPERSYFLFGARISYSLPEIQSIWPNANDIMVLRQFLGNAQIGWKIAWSDRMVSMFTSLWLFGMSWGAVRKKVGRLPWWGLALFLLPMVIDGGTHMASDLAEFGQGFRDTNAWLAALTNHSLGPAFYAGDAWGSFNAWMRLITGILFGLGIVWFSFSYLDLAFTNSARVMEYKYQYRAWLKKEKERLLNLSSASVSQLSGADSTVKYQQEGRYDRRS